MLARTLPGHCFSDDASRANPLALGAPKHRGLEPLGSFSGVGWPARAKQPRIANKWVRFWSSKIIQRWRKSSRLRSSDLACPCNGLAAANGRSRYRQRSIWRSSTSISLTGTASSWQSSCSNEAARKPSYFTRRRVTRGGVPKRRNSAVLSIRRATLFTCWQRRYETRSQREASLHKRLVRSQLPSLKALGLVPAVASVEDSCRLAPRIGWRR